MPCGQYIMVRLQNQCAAYNKQVIDIKEMFYSVIWRNQHLILYCLDKGAQHQFLQWSIHKQYKHNNMSSSH